MAWRVIVHEAFGARVLNQQQYPMRPSRAPASRRNLTKRPVGSTSSSCSSPDFSDTLTRRHRPHISTN